MDRETSREAFLKALQPDASPASEDKADDEEFVYKGNVKKDLELTGLEYIELETSAPDGAEEAAEEEAPPAVPGETPDISVKAARKAADGLRALGKPIGRLCMAAFAPVIKPFRKGADTITRRDWIVFFALLGAVAAVILFSSVSLRVQNTYREKQALYTVELGFKIPSESPGTFRVDEEGNTFLETGEETEKDVTGEVFYYEGEDKLFWPMTGIWYDSGSSMSGKIEHFATVEASDGGCRVELKNGKSLLLKGVLYDNKDTYVFLEKVVLAYNGKRISLPALSSVKWSSGGTLEIYPYGEEGLLEYLETDAFAEFENGAKVNLVMDTLYYFNGSMRLMFVSLDAFRPLTENLTQDAEQE